MTTESTDQEPKSLLDKVDEGVDNGATNMMIGGGIGAYSAATFLAAGAICPACIIAAPLFLGIGAAQRHTFLKKKSGEHNERTDK